MRHDRKEGREMALSKDGQIVAQISGKMSSQYCESGLWRCFASPSGAHHWVIDARGLGQCKYCGERRPFADAGVLDYGDSDDSEWDSRPLSEEWLRDLLPVA